MNDQGKLRTLILNYAPGLNIAWAEPVALLATLAEIESAFGLLALPKHEPAFDYGGKFCNHELWLRWGAWSACSYSSFQIMFVTAHELGFTGSPVHLCDDETAIHWVLEYIRKRIIDRGCTSIEQFADAYNSGSFKDSFVPTEYVQKFVAIYEGIAAKRNLYNGGINV